MAFTESLRKRGYAPDGTRLDKTDNIPVLFGTAQLNPVAAILKAKTEDLTKETDAAVARMCNIGRGPMGLKPHQKVSFRKLEIEFN